MAERHRGYALLWRKFFDHPFWQEPRCFSKAEAWLDIVFCLARGTNDPESGLNRAEFRASLTWLAFRWMWDKAKTQRFVTRLTTDSDPMLERVRLDGSGIWVYRVRNFEKYQTLKQGKNTDTASDTASDTLKPASIVGFRPRSDTASDTASDTNIKESTNKENPADGRHRPFVDFLFNQHPEIVIGPADFKALKDFLKATKNKPAYELAKLKEYWLAFQSSRDEFDRKQGTSLQYFCRQINRFVRLTGQKARAQQGLPL